MIDPTRLMERAKSIRAFIQDQATRSEYIAERFTNLFKLSDTHSSAGEGRPSKPGTPALRINSTAETAFQRAIFNQGTTEAEFISGIRTLAWLDYELPYLPGSTPRRGACDLIAKIQDGDTTICEAKYSPPLQSSGSRDPDHAVIELLFQLQAVAFNAHLFGGIRHQGERFVDFSWGDIGCANIALVVANRSWWRGKGERDRTRISRLIDDVRIEVGIDILLFQTEDVEFNKLLDPFFPYEPRWPEGISTRWEPALRF